jgi:hypothetical protein
MNNPNEEYTSLWESTKVRSIYHFDKWRQESPGEVFKVLGNLDPTWTTELEEIKRRSVPKNWTNLRHTDAGNQNTFRNDLRAADLAKGGGDIDKIILTNTFHNFDEFPELKKVINYFCLEQAQARCNIQLTGQVFTNHIDLCHSHFHGDSNTNIEHVPDYLNRIVRITIMLEDWEPGQFKIFGNQVYQQWHAGDYYMHDWENVPHATANASEHARPTMQITGLRTEATDKIIGNTHFKRRYP